MIVLERMYVNQQWLDWIADWRNESMESLRAVTQTRKGIFQKDWVESMTDREQYFYIVNKADHYMDNWSDMLCGYCGLDKINPIHATAEMSLLVSPLCRKEGVGTKAVNELLKFGFKSLGLKCIYIEVLATTQNWWFWEKQGFQQEGELRWRFFKDGAQINSTIGSILKSEWEERQ